MKKSYRFFGGFLDRQEKWLNNMAQAGHRLQRTGKISYEFSSVQPGAYQYAVVFVAQMSDQKEQTYKDFLEDLGYRVFYKNANLNISIGKIKWRPYGQGMGQISTNPGNYNKELLIVEKKNDGRPFELHTTNFDKATYYKSLRNAWLSVTAMLLSFAILFGLGQEQGFATVLCIILGLLCAGVTLGYQKRIAAFSTDAKIEE